MKKHNEFLTKIILCLFALIIIFLTGCQSAPVGNVVEPVELLSNNKAYYFLIPSNFNDEIYEKVLENYSPELHISQNNVDLIKKYIKKFYISTDFSKNLNKTEIIIEGDFPSNYIKRSLSKNKNLVQNVLESDKLKNKYKYFSFGNLKICIVSNQMAFISNDIESILIKYEEKKYSESLENDESKYINPKIYEFFTSDELNIKIYTSKNTIISDYIKNLVNIKIELPEFAIYQTIKKNDFDVTLYDSDIKAEFNNAKFAKTTKSLLNFISPFSDDVIINVNENIINIENIKIEKKYLYDLFK